MRREPPDASISPPKPKALSQSSAKKSAAVRITDVGRVGVTVCDDFMILPSMSWGKTRSKIEKVPVAHRQLKRVSHYLPLLAETPFFATIYYVRQSRRVQVQTPPGLLEAGKPSRNAGLSPRSNVARPATPLVYPPSRRHNHTCSRPSNISGTARSMRCRIWRRPYRVLKWEATINSFRKRSRRSRISSR